MKKLLLLFLLILTACSRVTSEPPYEPPILTAMPTRAATSTPIPADAQARVREELGKAMAANPPFIEQETPSGGTISYYQLSGLSTGKLRAIELGNYTLDVLDVYLPMIPGPISVPLVVGISGNGDYVSLVVDKQDLPRSELLAEVSRLYPAWQQLRIMFMGDFITSTGANWDACTGEIPALQLTLGNEYCAVGKLLEDTYQAEMSLLRIQALNAVPANLALPWLLMPPIELEESQPTLSPSEIDNLPTVENDNVQN